LKAAVFIRAAGWLSLFPIFFLKKTVGAGSANVLHHVHVQHVLSPPFFDEIIISTVF
jgi:hypothetical protein